MHPGEGKKRKVAGVEHQLNTHEHDDRVAPHKHADSADHEQDHRKPDEVCRGYHCSSPASRPDGEAGSCGSSVAGGPAFVRCLPLISGWPPPTAGTPPGAARWPDSTWL